MGVEGGGAQQTMREEYERQRDGPSPQHLFDRHRHRVSGSHSPTHNMAVAINTNNSKYSIVSYIIIDGGAYWQPSVPALLAVLGRLLPAGR